MSTDRAATLRALLLRGTDPVDAAAIATNVAGACTQLSVHVARLVGELGVQTLFDRTVHLAAEQDASFKDLDKRETTTVAVRARLAELPPRDAIAAGEVLLTTFIALLERFIGTALVANLLRDVWPESFRSGGSKEPT